MAKFRQNHSKASKGNSFAIRGLILTLILIGALLFGFYKINAYLQTDQSPSNSNNGYIPVPSSDIDFIPKGKNENIIHHKYFSLAYNESNEQADWVAYKLTKQSLLMPNVKRSKSFLPDYDVKTRSAYHRDYTNSGYTRGHLAPAGDMAFNEKAMQESFFMSNMCPQLRAFNNAVWRELEENVRNWAFENEEIYVVSGPVFYNKVRKRIGENKVAVPDAFFKVILDIKTPSSKSIGFLIPHEKTDKHLKEFAVAIDYIEKLVQLDLFPELYEDVDQENRIESTMNSSKWKFDQQRFRARVEKWNYE